MLIFAKADVAIINAVYQILWLSAFQAHVKIAFSIHFEVRGGLEPLANELEWKWLTFLVSWACNTKVLPNMIR